MVQARDQSDNRPVDPQGPGPVPYEGPGSLKGVVALLWINWDSHAENVVGLLEVASHYGRAKHLKGDL